MSLKVTFHQSFCLLHWELSVKRLLIGTQLDLVHQKSFQNHPFNDQILHLESHRNGNQINLQNFHILLFRLYICHTH